MHVYIDTDRCDDCEPGFCEVHGEMLENPRPEFLTFELSWGEMAAFVALHRQGRELRRCSRHVRCECDWSDAVSRDEYRAHEVSAVRLAERFGAEVDAELQRAGIDRRG